MVGKSQGGTVRGRGGFILLAPRKNVITALSLPTNRPAIGAWKAAMAATQTLIVDEEHCYPASSAEMKEPLTHRR